MAGYTKHISAWKADPEHQRAQRLGRDGWYSSYRVEVVRIERGYAGPSSANGDPI
jgi:heme-degrading monooxygenase HmoA